MAKHSRKNSCWIPNSISRYNGVIYAAILRHIGEPSFRKRYGAYLERLKGYLGDIEKEPDQDSCLVEISAAERSVNTVTRAALFDPAAAPLSQTFGLDLSRLSDPDIIERAKLFIQAIKDVPKRFIAAAVLAGMLFAGGGELARYGGYHIPRSQTRYGNCNKLRNAAGKGSNVCKRSVRGK